MSVKSKVSVLLLVHNGLPFLDEALSSILGQTLADIEMIVLDDASKTGRRYFGHHTMCYLRE